MIGFSLLLAALGGAEEPQIRPTLPWLGAQLLPSPELSLGDGAGFGLRWQLTPLLYSFGIHRSLSPWRTFVVEPLTRQSGSIELHLSPEYLTALDDHFGGRVGVKSYFPVWQRGDNLSFSLGASYLQFGSRRAAAYEAGIHVMAGFVGIEVAYAPLLDPVELILALKLRAF
jgi:hypothetical protein